QGAFAQNGYAQTGYTQPQAAGYPNGNGYPQQNGYPQPNGYPQAGSNTAQGYPYQQNQQPAGSYIPQTPYSPGYTTPGYQAPGSYAQGYAYTQMGRQQPAAPMQDHGGQVPLNGGGYTPPPVPVRKQPFKLTDTYLLIISAVLLVFFVLGMFISGMGMMKWIFLVLTGGAIALLWLKPLTENNKRLCFSIVFGLLALVTLIGLVTGGGQARRTANPQPAQQEQSVNGGNAAQNQNPYGAAANNVQITPAPPVEEVTPVPEGDDSVIYDRLNTFLNLWAQNDLNGMINYCYPEWVAKQDNVTNAIFKVTRNWLPIEYQPIEISGTAYDTMRTILTKVTINKNNGQQPQTYQMEISLKKADDGLWYVDPSSIQSNEDEQPTVTPVITPSPSPDIYASTVLYYNPDGGSMYHKDPNCKKVGTKYAPLKGQFTYGELVNGAHPELKACHICGSPDRPEQ
ncbi:MAG: hypothetical protein J6Y48_07415, partial [Clostridia bacterium]|nr:hypothetical protein [Clostridia bacterium]